MSALSCSRKGYKAVSPSWREYPEGGEGGYAETKPPPSLRATPSERGTKSLGSKRLQIFTATSLAGHLKMKTDKQKIKPLYLRAF